MELLQQIIGVLLPLILIPVVGFLAVRLGRLLNRWITNIECDIRERTAREIVLWGVRQFRNLSRKARFEAEVKELQERIPGLSLKLAQEAIGAAAEALETEIELGKTQGSDNGSEPVSSAQPKSSPQASSK